MNAKLKAAFEATLADAASLEELSEIVDSMPEPYQEAIADAIEARKAELAPAPEADETASTSLADATAAELAELLASREDLRDALAPLYATKEEDSSVAQTEDEKVTDGEESDLSVSGDLTFSSASITLDESLLLKVARPTFDFNAGDTKLSISTDPGAQLYINEGSVLAQPPADIEDAAPADVIQLLVDEANGRMSDDLVASIKAFLAGKSEEKETVTTTALDAETIDALISCAQRLGVETDGVTPEKLLIAVDRTVAQLPLNHAHNRNTSEPRVADRALYRLFGEA